MMTLKELKAVQLETKGRNAYKAESVDNYMDMVEDLVEQLYKANSDLEEKITILADKLEEYMGREESITETLLSAQKVRDSIINDAKAQASDILASSQKEAKETIDDIRVSVREEQEHYLALQKEVSDFKTKILSLYKQHLDLISEIPNFEHETSEPEKDENSTEIPENEKTEEQVHESGENSFVLKETAESAQTQEEGNFKITF